MNYNRFQKALGCLGRFKWTLHNLIAHPISEILWLIYLERASHWIHEVTIPEHLAGEARE